MVAGFLPDVALLWMGLPMAVVCAGLLYAWTVRGTMPVWVSAVAAVVLLVNLLAAGGIGFPGVAQNWWLLMAITLGLLDVDRPLKPVPRVAAAGAGVVAVLLVLAFHQTMYQPVLGRQASINEGSSYVENRRFDQAEAAYARAALADPYSAEPWMHLASLHQRLAIESLDESRIQPFDHAAEEALKRDRRSHRAFGRLGNMRLELYCVFGDPEQLDRAIEAYRRWVQLYPNNNLAHAQLAWAYSIAGEDQYAAREAQRALELDKLNPHWEKRLSEQQVYYPANKRPEDGNAEQLMKRLRSDYGES